MSNYDDDFKDIDNCGGKYIVKFDKENGGAVSFSYTSSNPWPSALYGVYALVPQGIPVGVFFIGGINQGYNPPPPDESNIGIFMLSDREGFFGRVCPHCKKYFRTESPSVFKPVTCPYCGLTAATHYFLTEGHREFIKAHTDAFVEAFTEGKDVAVDLDELSRQAAPNRPPHYFFEEKQQTRFKCSKCNVKSDILGVFGYCPNCGHRNSMEILNAQLDQLEDKVKNPRYTKEQRLQRENEWRDIVKQCVSYFEGYARDLQSAILNKVPFIPSRKKAIEKLSFHNPIQTTEELEKFLGIDILNGINVEEKEFINRRFHRRHLYEHSTGVVDQDYIEKSGDTSVRLGQLIRESSSNALTLINLTRRMAENFDKGFHDIE